MYEKKFCVRVPLYYLTNSLLQYDSFLIKTISYINDQSGKIKLGLLLLVHWKPFPIRPNPKPRGK